MVDSGKLCMYNGCTIICHKITSLSVRFSGKSYKGNDGELVLCPIHFDELYVYYHEFKTLEDSKGCSGILMPETNLMCYDVATLTTLLNVISRIIELRSAMQSKLRVSGENHVAYVEKIKKRLKEIRENIYDREWPLLVSSGYRHNL